MPSPLARLDGDITRLACGFARHHAPSTSIPNAVSAAPYGRGSTNGSRRVTPCTMTGAGGGGAADPHPARARAVTPTSVAARSSYFMRSRFLVMRMGRSAGAPGFMRTVTFRPRDRGRPRGVAGRADRRLPPGSAAPHNDGYHRAEGASGEVRQDVRGGVSGAGDHRRDQRVRALGPDRGPAHARRRAGELG